jgi:hypothetical protein
MKRQNEIIKAARHPLPLVVALGLAFAACATYVVGDRYDTANADALADLTQSDACKHQQQQAKETGEKINLLKCPRVD